MARGKGDDGPHPVDRHVGRRVCEKRLALGYNQSDLGRALGLTFQQIQKYEKGTNRVGGSRLHAVAKALGVEVSALFEGLETGGDATIGLSNDAIRFATEFDRLSSGAQRSVKSVINALVMVDGRIKEAAANA